MSVNLDPIDKDLGRVQSFLLKLMARYSTDWASNQIYLSDHFFNIGSFPFVRIWLGFLQINAGSMQELAAFGNLFCKWKIKA
jgi:hypothetical protein